MPVGGGHVTNDIARGLSTPVVHAERMKTLYGAALPSPADDREVIDVPQVGEDEDGQPNHVPKSLLIGIIQPRDRGDFELVRSRLEASGFDKVVGRRVVLTGGASQLPGARELARLVLDKQIRMGRPLRPRRPGRIDRRPRLRRRRRAHLYALDAMTPAACRPAAALAGPARCDARERQARPAASSAGSE